MNRQYIGARYVPTFFSNPDGSNNWIAGIPYEALTIVTYLNNSYTSKVAVPVGIGSPNNNPEYWILTGNYNAQVESYRQETIRVAGRVDDIYDDFIDIRDEFAVVKQNVRDNTEDIADIKEQIKDIKNRKFIFIGDSYDDYSHWITKTANILGLTENVDYWNIALSGSSFSAGTWLSQLQNWVSGHTDKVDEITDIICGGGINDADPIGRVSLATNLVAFSRYVKDVFNKNCLTQMYWFGWALDSSPILAGRDATNRSWANRDWCRCTAWNGMVYVPGCEMVLHNKECMSSDGLHPNDEGGSKIAEQVANGIKIGCSAVSNNMTAPVYPTSGQIGSGNIRQVVSNGMINFSVERLSIMNCSYTFSGTIGSDGWTEIGTCVLPLGNKVAPFNITLLLHPSGGHNKFYNCLVKFENDKMYMMIPNIVNDVPTPVTIDNINEFSFSTTYAGIFD